MLRKLSILMLCVTLIASYYPPKKAHAFVPVVAGVGVEVAVGAWVLGAFALAEGAGLLGYTVYEDQVNEYARNVWLDANSAIKQSMYDSYNYAILTGNKTMELGSDVIAFIKSKLTDTVKMSVMSTTVSGVFGMNKGCPTSTYCYYSPFAASGYTLLTGSLILTGPLAFQLDFYHGDMYFQYPAGGYLGPFALPLSWVYNTSLTDDYIKSLFLTYMGSFSIVPNSTISTINAASTTMQSHVPTFIAAPAIEDIVAFPKVGYGSLNKTKRLIYDPAIDGFKDSVGNVFPKTDVGYATPPITIGTDVVTGDLVFKAEIGTAWTDVMTGEKTLEAEGTPPPTIAPTPRPTPKPAPEGTPQNKFNPFKWLKYLFDYIVWFIVALVALIATLGEKISVLNSLTSNLRDVLKTIFLTLPPEVLTLFTVAILLAIVGGVLRRKK